VNTGTIVLGMPRARRRRRSAARRGWSRTLTLFLILTVATVVIVGSLVEVHAQSDDFRTSTDTGYAQLATLVAEASDQTAAQLAQLMQTAPQLPVSQVPQSARAEVEQGLDRAVDATSDQATRAAGLVPPQPSGAVSARFTQVMDERAEATADLRASIDQLLGISPAPIAGAPNSVTTSAPSPGSTVARAAAAMGSAGLRFEGADDSYRALVAYVRRQHLPVALPSSVWVPAPVENAPLGSAQLAATASAMASSPALVPVHQLVITALGLSPPAVASGGPGIVGDGCRDPGSAVPGPAPTVLPPTSTVSVGLTITNCGTITETGVVVNQNLTIADPAGTAPPPVDARGGKDQQRVTLASGSSVALTMPSLTVAGGHLYLLDVSVAVPTDQANPAGTTQQFLLQITD
jgi:hypothetical protein